MHSEDSSFSERTRAQFDKNPLGLTVQLHDGSRFVVAGVIEGPRERWLRLRTESGRFASFVRSVDVASVIYTEVSVLGAS